MKICLEIFSVSYLLAFCCLFCTRAAENGRCLFLNAFLFVCAIEVFQLVTNFGAFDVDDILLNCLGALCGYCLFSFCFLNGKGEEKGRFFELYRVYLL